VEQNNKKSNEHGTHNVKQIFPMVAVSMHFFRK